MVLTTGLRWLASEAKIWDVRVPFWVLSQGPCAIWDICLKCIKSREVAFSHKLCGNCPIVLTFCTEHGSDTAMLCAKFQNNWTIKQMLWMHRVFARFESKMSVGQISYISQPLASCLNLQLEAVNSLRPRQNGHHFADGFFKPIFLNENVRISFKISLKFVPLVQLTIFMHWFWWWLGAAQATSHYLNQWWLDYRRKYASLGLNELISQWVFLYI